MSRISDLAALTGATVDTAADLLPIVDMSETGAARNKKITVAEFFAGIRELVDDRMDAVLVAGANVSIVYDDGAGTLTIDATPPAPGDISGFNEAVDDRVAALLVAGSGIGKVYNDGAGTLTLTATAVSGGMAFQGAIDCSANPDYPAASTGHAYVVSVAGKIGGASGESVDAGDLIIATADNAGGTEASVGASWIVVEHNGVYKAAAPGVQAVSSSATVTPTFSNDLVKITAQAAGLTLANWSGTAVPGWGMAIRIKDNGTARSIAYGSKYRAIGVTLPTTTVINKTLYLGCIYNSEDDKIDVVAVAQEA